MVFISVYVMSSSSSFICRNSLQALSSKAKRWRCECLILTQAVSHGYECIQQCLRLFIQGLTLHSSHR